MLQMSVGCPLPEIPLSMHPDEDNLHTKHLLELEPRQTFQIPPLYAKHIQLFHRGLPLSHDAYQHRNLTLEKLE